MQSEKMIVSVRIKPQENENPTESLSESLSESPSERVSPFLIENNKLQIKEEDLKVKNNPLMKLNNTKSFIFDNIFTYKSSQTEVFEKSSKGIVEGLFMGHSGTILAYGKTGTGKTYTMTGNIELTASKNSYGIIPRTFDLIFEKIKSDKKNKYNLFMSYTQIYMESIYDLFEPSNEQIRINDDNQTRAKIEGVQWIKVNSPEECMNMLQLGEVNKYNFNNEDVKSNNVVILRLEKTAMEKGSAGRDTHTNITKASLLLVDLAGSEKVKKSKSGKFRIDEFVRINHPISIIRDCLTSYSGKPEDKISQFSYKNSKLTRLLQDSLKGNTKLSLIINILDSSLDEDTISSLIFAQKAMNFTCLPGVNMVREINYRALSNKLQEDLDLLNDEYTRLKKEFDLLQEENKTYQEEIFNLQKKISNGDNLNLECALKTVEELYEEKFKKKDSELLMVFEETENIILEKDELNGILSKEIKSLREENHKLTLTVKDLTAERDDLLIKLIESGEDSIGSFFKKPSKSGEKVHAETQTDSEVMDPQLAELLKNVGRKGKSLMENMNFRENNSLYKLEYFIVRFEKEIFRLNKENKDLKEKLKKFDWTKNLSRSKNCELTLDSCFKPVEKKISNNGLTTPNVNSNNNTFLSPKDFESNNLENETKILELKNEILKLKTIIYKKNKKIAEYEKTVNKNNQVEQYLVQAKNNLVNISNCLKDNKSLKSTKGSNFDDKISEISDNFDSKSVIPNLNTYKQEYEQKIKTLKKAIEKLQISVKNKQTDIELSQLVENKLKSKIESLNLKLVDYQKLIEEKEKEVYRIKEFYTYKVDQIKAQYAQLKDYLDNFRNFMDETNVSFEKVKDFFNIFTIENKKHYVSELFEKDFDFQNLDVYNYSIFLHKINSLNYIVKLDEELDFDGLFYCQEGNKTENMFTNSYNKFAKNLLQLFEILLKTMITENTKIFYFMNNLNNLIKLNILSNFDNSINQLTVTYQAELIKKQDMMHINSADLNENLLQLKETYELELEKLKEEKKDFEKNISKAVSNFDYKIININNDNLFHVWQTHTSSIDNTLKVEEDTNIFKIYLKMTQNFLFKVDKHLLTNKTNESEREKKI